MNKRMPYAVYKRFFSQYKTEEYNSKNKSINVIDIPEQQDLVASPADDIHKESRYRYYVICGTDESWRMDNFRIVKLPIMRVDYGNAHYWRAVNDNTTVDFWMLADAIAWARQEAPEILAKRKAARGL